MPQVKPTNSFHKDYKRHCRDAEVKILQAVTYLLENDLPLPPMFRDHKLVGRLSHCREWHIKPNLLLIYERLGDSIKFHRLCNHSELFGA